MAEDKITLKQVISKIEKMDEFHKFEWTYSILKSFGNEFISHIFKEAYEQGKFDKEMECSTPKVEIPDYVSYWLEYCKATNINLVKAIKVLNVHLYNYARMADADKLRSYFSFDKNQESFMGAWINGYSVKKEKYYYVAVPVEHGRFRRLYVLANGSVALGDHNYESLELLKKYSRQATYQLTEELIKESPLSWAWQFAKELED
jgi:hypothetical protein